MPRLSKAERAAAAAPISYLPVPGPPVPHPLARVPQHVARRPQILQANGRTLVQPRLPPLYSHSTFGAGDSSNATEDPDDDRYDARDIIPSESNRPPTPDPTQHRRKREAQWRRWQGEVLPNLLPHYVRILHETKSLRHADDLRPAPRTACACIVRVFKIAIVHFTSVDDIELDVCKCSPAAVQLMEAGAFPCAPLQPSLAVDLRVLEFALNLFVQISPNNTAFTLALERTLGALGFQLDHKNSLRRRFGNCLMWYAHLRNRTKERYSAIVEAARIEHLPHLATEEEQQDPAPQDSVPPTATPRGRQLAPAHSPRSRSSSATPTPSSPTPGSAPSARKRRRETPPPPELPFPEPRPRTRPSEYLRRRCPACFGDLRHDPTSISDVKVCIDACFTQKKRKSPKDPPKTHPNTHFVPETVAAQTETYVDSVRNVEAKQKKRPRSTVEEEPDGYDHPALHLPRSVLDGCEASFKAADEKREKASTEFFEDTALMALLCRHDRVLWLVNMHSAGERQFNVIALLETLFQHLPLDIAVGALYDVACALERSCRKWGFLARYMDRLAFAVSVFHAFGHEWACQLLFHPRKRVGFGFMNGEGCERFWHSISHLIAHLRISGYHNRLYTLDSQIEHADEASLLRLGEWIRRRHIHSGKKRAEAKKALVDCGKPINLLRAQWQVQVQSQTKPIPRRSKTRGQQAVAGVVLLRAAMKTRKAQVSELQRSFLEAVEDEDPDAASYQIQFESAKEALASAEKNLRQKEQALGVEQYQALNDLGRSEYINLRMNARALKLRLRERLRSRKFELDRVERSYRRLTTEEKLRAHTESAVKRREPTISKLNSQYNKLCADVAKLIKDGKGPVGAIPPMPIPSGQLWQLDVDDGIWQDVGLDDDDDGEAAAGTPPPWLCDEKVRSGIKAMLELDRCDEEDIRLRKERCALQVWFAEEWAVINLGIQQAELEPDKYQLQLRRDGLVILCATWEKWLPDLGVDQGTLPPWGPSAGQLANCVVDAHLPARGEDRHYESWSDEEGDEEVEAGGEDEDFGTLEAIETADIYRNSRDDDY